MPPKMIRLSCQLVALLIANASLCFGQEVTPKTASGKKLSDLIYLAQVAGANGDYDQAMKHLDDLMINHKDTIVSNFKLEDGWTYGLCKAPLHALCLFRKAEIYRVLKQPENALDQYNELTRRYRDHWMARDKSEGFGWQMPVPLQATHKMYDMYESKEASADLLSERALQAYKATRNSLAKTYAANLYAKLQSQKGNHEEAAAVLTDIIGYYDDQKIFTYKAQVNYSASSIALLYEILFTRMRDESKASAELDKIAIQKRQTDPTASLVAMYYHAKAKDNGLAHADSVKNAYLKFLHVAPKDLEVNFDGGSVLTFRQVNDRYNLINGFWQREAQMTAKAKVFVRPDSTSAVLREVSAGETVALQYPGEGSSFWNKVLLQDGSSGWMSINSIRVSDNAILFKDRKYSNWPLFDKDRKVQRHTSGKAISRPGIRYALENVVGGRVVFFDITADNIPEVFAAQFDPKDNQINIICMEGTQPKILWRTKVSDCVRLKNGFIVDSTLHIGCYQLNAYSGNVERSVKNSNASDEYAGFLSGLRKFNGRLEPSYDDTTKIVAFNRDAKKHEVEIVSYDRVTDNKLWTARVAETDEIVFKEINGKNLVIITRSDRNVPKLFIKTFELSTGALLYNRLITNRLAYLFYATPIRVKDHLLMAASDSLHVYSYPDGTLKWKTRGQVSSAAVVGNTLYSLSGALSDRGTLYAHNLENGKQLWSFDVGRPITANISCAGGTIAVNAGSTVYFIDDHPEKQKRKR